MFANLILALIAGVVSSIISLIIGITSNITLVIIVSALMLLFEIMIGATALKNGNMWKKVENAGEDYYKAEIEAIKNPDKKDKSSKDVECMDDFFHDVIELGYKKHLYLMITPTEEGLSLIHQNPGTTDIFEIIDCITIPSGKKGTNLYKACLAKVEEALDDFIKENKDKLILEDMKIDVEA